MEKVREHIIFYGEVQGVGFRYRAKYLAQYLDITGFVRNQWDGSVEMEAQGREKDIEALVEELENMSFVSVSDIERERIALIDESGFRVTY
ncbi:MAG: acylphosphatase [Parasporobacterium sp.]|nr:acylphosphatase [Parasporobacterium sp.]